MRIVVTGALGHIGSRLVRELPDAFPGAEIVMVDDLSSQRYPSLFDLPNGVSYGFVEGDVLDADLEALFEDADHVVHLAAVTDATRSFDDSDRVERVNLNGTLRVAEACAATNTPLVFPSTTSVYGPQSDYVDEDCGEADLNPQSPYAESKLAAERALSEMGDDGSLRHTAFRFGTIFGTSPGMRFHTVVNKFCWLAVTGQPLTVWRDALNQRRPYLDLGDAVRAVTKVLREDLYDGETYNVVTQNLTVRQLVEVISDHVLDVDITYVDEEIVNQHSYEVSNAKFTDLGFVFDGDVERGVEETVDLLAGLGSESFNRRAGADDP